jgi:conjugal transfer pilus assembly protein TraB
MSKQPYDADKNVDTQPSRIRKKQQKVLAIGIMIASILGWSLYSLLSNHAQSHRAPDKSSSQRMALDNPTRHVDGSEVFIEKTQNELSQTKKTTSALQHQLEILTQQKEEQEKTNQSNNESMQALQVQLKALEEKLNLANPASPGKGYGQNAYPMSPNLDHQADRVSIQPLKGVNDDVLALSPLKNQSVMIPQIKPSKTPDSFVPAGTFVRAVMLGGADASTGVNSQGNPTPVLFRLLDTGTLPNHHHSHLKDCVATAAAIGDISSERGLMRLERLSCVSPNHQEVIELQVEGTVFGPEGKNGVRGVPLWREGALLKRAFIAGSLSGFSQGIASQYTTTALSTTGAVTSVNNSDIFKFGAAQGVSNAMDKIADYNIRRADQYHPVIQLSAGTIVDVVFLKGFYLDGQKHDNEKESILPPFESVASLPTVLPSSQTAIPATNSAVASPLPVSPLPLTQAQINALQTRNHQNQNQNQAVDFFKP